MKKRGPFAVFLFPSFGRFSTMRSNGLLVRSRVMRKIGLLPPAQ